MTAVVDGPLARAEALVDEVTAYSDADLAVMNASERAWYHRQCERAAAAWARAHEHDWSGWLKLLFPDYFRSPFAEHHRRLWEWVWAIERGVRPGEVCVAVWSRGGAKSTSAEAAVAALGARGRRQFALYVCHAKGTPIFTDGRWMNVEDHPTAEPRVIGRTLRVSLAGLPFDEVVTPEHRYWARRIARRDRKGTAEIRRTPPAWIEAEQLDWNTWLGLPIDQRVDAAPAEFTRWNYKTRSYEPAEIPWADDPEFWWAVGLWWGDGTLGGARRAQISWSTADAHAAVRDRLVAALRSFGCEPRVRPSLSGACADVTICHSALGRWLSQWKVGRNSRKTPPSWVEQLPHDLQRALMRGYFDADGSVSERDVNLISVHLDGLLVARRILARLGIPSTIVRTRPERVGSIDGRAYQLQATYRLRIAEHADSLGFDVVAPTNEIRDVWIDEGCVWSRVRDVVQNGAEMIVPITTDTHEYLSAFARSHNCDTQQQADDHVQNVAGLLETSIVAMAYPELGSRAVSKYGTSKGWRRNRLRTASGLVIDALGLDTAARGIKVDEFRPDLMIFDDIDNEKDGPGQVEKKINDVTQKLLPAGDNSLAVLVIQNIPNPQGVVARLAGIADEPAEFLRPRIVIGPVPALEDFTYEQRGDGSYEIVHGVPTWEGQSLERCQEQVNEWGITAFRTEAQHETDARGGGMFDHLQYHHCRIEDVPWAELTQIAVWCDPAVTTTDNSDSQAVQADGLTGDGAVFRLRSWEERATPVAAIKLAVSFAIRFGTRKVGIETDQGGDTWNSVYKEAVDEVRADLATLATGGTVDGPAVYVQTLVEIDADDLVFPLLYSPAQEKAGTTQQSKASRAQQMLAAYETRTIVHVLGTHLVLERGLNRFPARKPFDIVDAAYWSLRDLLKFGQHSTTSARQTAARTLRQAPLRQQQGRVLTAGLGGRR